MILLLLFALLAGAGTAITPCVLPVLPALLSASALGGRRRPVGIVLGLAITFTITIVLLATLVNGVGLGSGAARTLAIVVLIAFGLVLLVPGLAQRVQAPLSRLARFGPKQRGDGFWSGLGVGGALGFVCAPCAGPILAAVTAVSASTGPTVRVVLVAIAYSLGLAAVMLVYGFGGRAVLGWIKSRARGHIVERGLGIVLIATGVLMAFNLDVRFEDVLANHTNSLPGFLTDPTRGLEDSGSVQKRLLALRPASRFATKAAKTATTQDAVGLQSLGVAPNFVDTQDFVNTPGDKPLTMASMRGHVVLIDFWTYTCINCIRTLPYVKGLYAHYHKYGLDVVGIETPEFTFEQNASNVRQAIAEDGIKYPVVQDNRYGTWDAWGNEYWPAEYYVDANGEVRHDQFGEGGYSEDETVVRELLRTSGVRKLPARMTARAQMASAGLESEETYLDPQRAQAEQSEGELTWAQTLKTGTKDYTGSTASLQPNMWTLNGPWTVGSQSVTPAAGATVPATISGGVQARDVYLVMTSAGNMPRRGRVLINGKPIPAADRGTAVSPSGYFTVTKQTLYNLVKLKTDERFTITVQLPKGISAYDFTFG